jgi:hypothetical protein
MCPAAIPRQRKTLKCESRLAGHGFAEISECSALEEDFSALCASWRRPDVELFLIDDEHGRSHPLGHAEGMACLEREFIRKHLCIKGLGCKACHT